MRTILLMNSLKIILNVFYSPTEQLKQFIQNDEQTNQIFFPMNGGSKLVDNWSTQHLVADNTFDNISNLNQILNEMTSIYWFWKNYRPFPDYIGFNHYRRFFRFEDIKDYFQYDIVVAKPIFSSTKVTLAQQYALYHVISDLQACLTTIEETVGKDKACGFKTYLYTTGKNYAPCNMFIMKRKLFEEWCQFVFPLLFRLKDIICTTEDFKKRDNYQKRALCFLTERMFNYWCYCKSLTQHLVKEVDIDERLDFKPAKVNERGDYT